MGRLMTISINFLQDKRYSLILQLDETGDKAAAFTTIEARRPRLHSKIKSPLGGRQAGQCNTMAGTQYGNKGLCVLLEEGHLKD